MPLVLFILTLLSSYTLIIVTILHLSTLTIIMKCLSSILFLLTAWISYKKNPQATHFFRFIFAGLFFSFLGDTFLVFDKTGEGLTFILGVASFALGHIMYSIGYCTQSKFRLQDVFIFLCFFIPTLLIILLVNFEFKGLKALIIIYAILISFMVAKSFALRPYATQNPFAITCLITGSLLFFVSDCILLFLFFYKGAPYLLQYINWLLYYLGQALLAISFSKGKLNTPNTSSSCS